MIRTRSVAAALTVVTSTNTDTTHLAPTSPAIAGSSPDQLPTRTVCGQMVDHQVLGRPAWEVDCAPCLIGSSSYWQMPSWA